MNEVSVIDSNIISASAQSTEPIEENTTNFTEPQQNMEASVLGTYIYITR